MRREYLRQISAVDASATADTGFIPTHGARDSTNSPPSVDEDLETPAGHYAIRADSRPLMPAWLQYLLAGLTIISIIAGSIVYVAGMKSEIASSAATIKNLERSQDSLRDQIRHEVGRLEANIEKRMADLIALVMGQRAKKLDQETGKREAR